MTTATKIWPCAGLSQSRRGDSNPGPLHYEACAGVDRCGSKVGICRRYGRLRLFGMITRTESGELRLPSGFHTLRPGPSCSQARDELRDMRVEPIEHIFHRHRRTTEIGSLLVQYRVNPCRCAFVDAAEERIGMSDLDPERLARGGREVAQVGRDDRLRIVRRHGRREHVRSADSFVIRGSSAAIARAGISASSNARCMASISFAACPGVARSSSTRFRTTSSRIRRLQRTSYRSCSAQRSNVSRSGSGYKTHASRRTANGTRRR